MQIRLANKTDLPGIRYLMSQYGSKFAVRDSIINKRDVGIVAYAPSGELVGFIWAGFMCRNEKVYVDYFTVSPKYAKTGVGNALCRKLFVECSKRGAKTGFAVIKHDEHHDKSAMNALKLASMASPSPYTYIYIDKLNTLAELKDLK